jgi:hypothetical protein
MDVYDGLLPDGGTQDADGADCQVSREGRLLSNNTRYAAVIGENVDKNAPIKVEGVLVCPTSVEPNLYSRSESNALKAIEERVIKKVIKHSVTKDDKKVFERMVNFFVDKDGIFREDAVKEWAGHYPFDSLRSKKWTKERFEVSFEDALANPEPYFSPQILVKVENTKEAKAPRALIDDRACGQIYALATISCFETLLFAAYKYESIKGVGKNQALHTISSRLAHVGLRKEHEADVFEGDGSAWDTTCSLMIRDAFENVVLDKISQVLDKIGYVPTQFLKSHGDVNRARKLKLVGKRGLRASAQDGTLGGTFKVCIDSIRRSGHRGTSCLNWFVNKCCWTYALYGRSAPAALDLAKGNMPRALTDRWGKTRRTMAAFEGDDSILATSPRLTDSEVAECEATWKRLGFDMKIFIRNRGGKGSATFVGCEMAVDAFGLQDMFAPEIPRFFRGGASVSKEAVEAWKRGDDDTVSSVAAMSLLGKAAAFARSVPTLAIKMIEMAEATMPTSKFCDDIDHETSMMVYGACVEDIRDIVPVSFQDILANVYMQLGSIDDEKRYLSAIGRMYDDEEHTRFLARDWSVDTLRDWAGLREALPQSWRP